MAVLVFCSLVYALHFLLGALLPAARDPITPSGGNEGGPSPVQWEALLAELRALRMEIHGTRWLVCVFAFRITTSVGLCCGSAQHLALMSPSFFSSSQICGRRSATALSTPTTCEPMRAFSSVRIEHVAFVHMYL